MDTQSNNKNQEEEILEIVEDQVKPLTFDEEVKVENVFDYPILNAPTIRGGKIVSGSGDKTFRFEEDKGIWLGSADFDNAPFKVDMDGEMTATTGTFSGDVVIGSGDNVFKADSNGIYLGDANFNDAPFRVNMSGEVIASHFQTGTSADEDWIDLSEGRVSQKRYDKEVVYTDVVGDGGLFGINDDFGNHMLQMSVSDFGTIYGIGKAIVFNFDMSEPDSLLFEQGSKEVIFRISSDGVIRPNDDNLGSFGTSTCAWADIYAYDFHDQCSVYDDLDAVKLIKKIKPHKEKKDKHGHPKMDLRTLPDFARDEDKKTGKTARNLGRVVDLCLSAIKQLSQKVEQLEKKLNK